MPEEADIDDELHRFYRRRLLEFVDRVMNSHLFLLNCDPNLEMKSPSHSHLFSIPVFSNHDASLQFCSMLLLSKQSMRKGRQHVIVQYIK